MWQGQEVQHLIYGMYANKFLAIQSMAAMLLPCPLPGLPDATALLSVEAADAAALSCRCLNSVRQRPALMWCMTHAILSVQIFVVK